MLLGDVRLGLGGLCSIAYLQVLKLQRKQRREKTSAMINGPIANGVREEWFLWPGVLLFLAAMYRIEIWVDWVPSKQNPGDPYSRPLTDKAAAEELDKD